MIVIKVELHSAVTRKIKTLGKAVIINDDTEPDPKRGNYRAYILRKGDAGANVTSHALVKCIRHGRVLSYPRQSYVVWRLILRALRSCYPEEK